MKAVLSPLRKLDLAFIAILLAGLALRFWGINFGLPYTLAPDEPTHFGIALRIFKTGDLNPHWLNYPSLMFYLNALALVPFYLVGKGGGVFSSPSDIPFPEIVTMGVGRLALPTEFLLSRGLTALFGVGSIWLVYRIARELHESKWVARLAALLLAVSPASVYNSHLIRPDTFAVFFALLAFLWARRILDRTSVWNYVWAGVGAGLATSAKYNMPAILLPMLAAHFLRHGMAGIARKELYAGLGVSVLAFLLTTPYALLDYPAFVRDMGYEVSAQAAGHAGFEGNTFPWYLGFLWSTEGILVIASVVKAAQLILARSRNGLVLLVFPLVYFVFINQFVVRNDRTILPVLPFLHLLAALYVGDLYAWARAFPPPTLPPHAGEGRVGAHAGEGRVGGGIVAAGVAMLCAAMIVQPAQTTFAWDVRLTQPDGRDAARQWLEANLPAGTRIALEAYSPYLDTRRFTVYGIDALVDRAPEWYVQNGFEYLIFSQGMYGRFFAEPERYAIWVDKYNQFFARFPQVARFDDNGYEIRVYKTGVALPAHRVAARFGNYGDLVELVGYDEAKWTQGEPLQIRLFWRALGDKPEPLQVQFRLLGQDNREIAQTQQDLFQGKGWRDGMFGGVFPLPVPADLPPGEYRLQVNVIWTRFAYSLPAFSWAEQRIDPVLLQPIELE